MLCSGHRQRLVSVVTPDTGGLDLRRSHRHRDCGMAPTTFDQASVTSPCMAATASSTSANSTCSTGEDDRGQARPPALTYATVPCLGVDEVNYSESMPLARTGCEEKTAARSRRRRALSRGRQ